MGGRVGGCVGGIEHGGIAVVADETRDGDVATVWWCGGNESTSADVRTIIDIKVVQGKARAGKPKERLNQCEKAAALFKPSGQGRTFVVDSGSLEIGPQTTSQAGVVTVNEGPQVFHRGTSSPRPSPAALQRACYQWRDR